MKILGINQELCINCEGCINVCPSHLFVKKDEKGGNLVCFIDPLSNCIKCGHCISICPSKAINYEGSEQADEFPDNWAQIRTNFSTLKTFLRSKRSVRRFKTESLPQNKIQQILDVMRYSPSATNARLWKFLIITNKQEIQQLSEKIVKTIKLTRKLVRNPLIRNLFIFGETKKQVSNPGFIPSLDYIIEESEKGNDPIFFKAPCVVILSSPKYGNLAGCDSGIAITYGMLAAESLGIGSCWIGIAQEAMQRIPNIPKKLGIKQKYKPWGCFVLGIPLDEYKRLPPRNPLEITWKN
jgi:nitroreductase/NAD-dependent dihydropyrimidine dehydrogenase PreA subunit